MGWSCSLHEGEEQFIKRVVRKTECKRPLEKLRFTWEDTERDLTGITVVHEDMNLIRLAQDRDRWQAHVNTAMNILNQ
jgi:hypothetical protein